jgi:glycosyltransferase involved in cell wall biosynthesis
MYNVVNTGARPEIFFYARPTTERRGFELGLMALDLVHRARPDLVINLVGEDVCHVNIPFPHRNLRGLQVGDLNEVYNRCAAGLVLSFTNMSLLPLELLAAGVIPVVNDGDNNRLVSDNPNISFAPASPSALARALLAAVDTADPVAASASVAGADWDASGKRFVSVLEEALRG